MAVVNSFNGCLPPRDERQARLAGWVFLVVNYLLRSWLWVLVALSGSGPAARSGRLGIELSGSGGGLPPPCGAWPGGGLLGGGLYEHGEHFCELGRQLSHP